MKSSWRIVPPLALATTLHAMVLGGVVSWHGGESTSGATRVSPMHASVAVRTAPAAATPAAPTVAPVAAPMPSEAPALAPATEASPPAPLAQAADSPVSEAPPPDAAVGVVDGVEVALAESTPSAAPADRYHARRELTRPPKPLTPIDIVFPPGVPAPGRQSAVLAIYIDELGQVRKVHTQGDALPQAFEDAARNAFLSASFRAGELDGRAVKSFIHVEVVFDEQPAPRGVAVSALGQAAH